MHESNEVPSNILGVLTNIKENSRKFSDCIEQLFIFLSHSSMSLFTVGHMHRQYWKLGILWEVPFGTKPSHGT